MLGRVDPDLLSDEQRVHVIEMSEEEWDAYEYREKVERDRISLLAESFQRGYRRGIAIGIEEARANKTREMALKMLNENISLDEIVKLTGISVDKLADLRKEISE